MPDRHGRLAATPDGRTGVSGRRHAGSFVRRSYPSLYVVIGAGIGFFVGLYFDHLGRLADPSTPWIDAFDPVGTLAHAELAIFLGLLGGLLGALLWLERKVHFEAKVYGRPLPAWMTWYERNQERSWRKMQEQGGLFWHVVLAWIMCLFGILVVRMSGGSSPATTLREAPDFVEVLLFLVAGAVAAIGTIFRWYRLKERFGTEDRHLSSRHGGGTG